MTRQISYPEYMEHFEYHGNTTIERIRLSSGGEIRHDWLMFDSVEDANDFFNDNCLQ